MTASHHGNHCSAVYTSTMKFQHFCLATSLALLTFPVAAAPLASQRAGFSAALIAAERGPLAAYATAAAPFRQHPLEPYLEAATLLRQAGALSPQRIGEFLDRHGDIAPAPKLRRAALEVAITRQDWAGFRLLFNGSDDPKLRCADLRSRLPSSPDSAFLDEAQALWLSGQSLPNECDAAFATLRAAGRITASLAWQRIDLAAQTRNTGLMRYLAKELVPVEKTRAETYAAFLDAPSQSIARSWPKDERSRAIAVQGTGQLAKKDPGVAEALLVALQDQLALSPSERGAVRNKIAYWSAASYLPETERRMAQVPADSFDAPLRELQVRQALARGDEATARNIIAAMVEPQKSELRWRYFAARLAERAGDAGAAVQFASIAREPSYYGFLAADRIDAPYALCPQEALTDAAMRKKIRNLPALVRAFELHAIARDDWARREWDATMKTLSADERRVAVALADETQWYDRAVFTLNSGDDLAYYALRFPLPHEKHLRKEAAKHSLDPAWIAALIRAESAWQADARSHANARGLMQLLPGTAQMEAKKRGLHYPGEAGLYDAEKNMTLGIAHLASMLDKHGGQPFLATAAYNAGPAPVARWLAQRPPRSIDLWVETIPYRETRDYVSRIAAFSAIYDWKLSGKARPVEMRLSGGVVPDAQRKAFVCPATLAATTTAGNP